MKYRLLTLVILVAVCSNNHFIQRAAGDYFPLAEGNIWRFVQGTDTTVVEVEPLEVLLGRECYPVSYGGFTAWYEKTAQAVDEYIKIVHFFSGNEYTVVEDYAIRMELPFVEGNTWQDSLVGSLDISGQLITAKYYIDGEITGYTYDEEHGGDVYSLELTKTKMIITPDTTYTETESLTEAYAPEIGLVRFNYGAGEYVLVDYELQE
jgi:hypothetical protein